MKHRMDITRDRCRICGLGSEDIVRLPFGKPRCEGKPDPVGHFMAKQIRERTAAQSR